MRQRQTPDAVTLMRQAGMEPDPWQAALLRSPAARRILLCSRQAGKSAVTALLALHQALTQPGSLILLLSPSLRQSGELFRKVMDHYRALQAPVQAQAQSALRIEWVNGSRIVSLPGAEQTVRGFSGVNLLVIDEAARVHDDLYHSVTPMVAVSSGKMILLSTPFGKRGFFYETWEHGEGWERTRITAYDCPRIPAEFLREEQATMPALWFQSEYLCEFVDVVDQVFATDDIQAALSMDVVPLSARR
jgi:hypothetical protein